VKNNRTVIIAMLLLGLTLIFSGCGADTHELESDFLQYWEVRSGGSIDTVLGVCVVKSNRSGLISASCYSDHNTKTYSCTGASVSLRSIKSARKP
jgi:hypothetical protein